VLRRPVEPTVISGHAALSAMSAPTPKADKRWRGRDVGNVPQGDIDRCELVRVPWASLLRAHTGCSRGHTDAGHGHMGESLDR